MAKLLSKKEHRKICERAFETVQNFDENTSGLHPTFQKMLPELLKSKTEISEKKEALISMLEAVYEMNGNEWKEDEEEAVEEKLV